MRIPDYPLKYGGKKAMTFNFLRGNLLPGFVVLVTWLLFGKICLAQGTETDDDAQNGLQVENMDVELENTGAFEEDLQDLFFPQKLNPNQLTGVERIMSTQEMAAIKQHIRLFGPLHSIWELQAVRGITTDRCRELVQFLSIPDPQKPYDPYTEVLFNVGLRNESFETSDHSVRVRGQTENGILYHFTGDHDDGEPFRLRTRQVGYDHISAGMDMMVPGRPAIRIIAGDYRAIFGQGLTLGQGFGIRKSVDLNLMARGTDQLRLHRSTSETMFMRGMAIAHHGDLFQLTVLGSVRSENATIHHHDPTGEAYFQSFSTAANDIAGKRRRSVKLMETAFRITVPGMRLNPGFTGYLRTTDIPMFTKNPEGRIQMHPLKQYRRFGFDWNGLLGTFYFFGEGCISATRVPAVVVGVIKAINRRTDVCILYRNYGYDPVTYNRTGISAGSTASNENGALIAATFKFRRSIQLKWLTDIYTKPLPQGLSPGPVHGMEHTMQLSRKWSKTALFYIQLGKKVKTIYQVNDDTKFKRGVDHTVWNYRLHMEYLLSPSVRARVRFMGAGDVLVSSRWSGLMYADLRIKPPRSGSSILLRWSLFTVPDYALRLYVYENDVLYNHRIPAFGRDGMRIFAIWSQKLGRNLQIQVKYGVQMYAASGSSDYAPAAPDLRVLVRWKS